MSIKCPECQRKFNYQTALCDDWRDPNKSFGCPHCGTFFVKDMNSTRRENLIPTIFIVGMMLPASNIIFRYFFNGGDPVVLVNTIFILLSAITIACLQQSRLFRPLEKSTYNKSNQAGTPLRAAP